jgi:two-component system sensor histidine kinase/response regulator
LTTIPLCFSSYIILIYLKLEKEKDVIKTELDISKNMINKLVTEEQSLFKAMQRQIDKRKKDRQRIKLNESESQIVLDSVVEGVIRTDEKGTINIFNTASEHMFGYKKDEVIGKNINILVPNIYSEKLGVTDKKIQKKIFGKSKSGKKFPLDITVNEARTSNKKEYVAIIYDISDKKMQDRAYHKYTEKLEWANYETQKARLEAERANYAKTLFLANMSHEIRTPLNGIIGMTELILNTKLSEKQERYANQIYNSGETLLEIINDILDFSKIEANALKLENAKFKLSDIIKNCENMFLPLYEEKGLELKIAYPKNIADDYIGDQVRLRQIITNLIGNSLKFTEKGSVTLTLSKKRTLKTKEILLFEVKDTGLGISENKQENIFDKFAQADASTTRKFGGTGLGLAICKQLVELMKGDIGVKSRLGKGSLFWFKIPLTINKPNTKTNSKKEKENAKN